MNKSTWQTACRLEDNLYLALNFNDYRDLPIKKHTHTGTVRPAYGTNQLHILGIDWDNLNALILHREKPFLVCLF